MLITGGCLCGAIRYQTAVEPFSVGHCHCPNCRKHSGAAFVTDALFKAATVKWSGESLTFYNSSENCARGFCAKCGSTVAAKYSSKPDIVIIATGSMDDPNLVTPSHHGFTSRRLKWIHMNDGLEEHEEDVPGFENSGIGGA